MSTRFSLPHDARRRHLHERVGNDVVVVHRKYLMEFFCRSMKQNLVVFLADLFNILEINPVKCGRYPEADKFSTGMYNNIETIRVAFYTFI